MSLKSNPLSDWLLLLEQRHPIAIDLGLERVRQVALRLKLTQFNCPVITVAGTNGKGSTVATLQSLAIAHDLNVGVYTSPHLLQFNERIAINGRSVDDYSLVTAFETVEQHRGEVSLTYFEFTTLAALLIFKQQSLDLLVLEVGMGGRLDAVNIVDADLAIITTIALDHEAYLGDTVEKIAAEKAGICRAGKSVILGDPDQISLLHAAVAPYHTKMLRAGVDFSFTENDNQWCWRCGELTVTVVQPLKLGSDLLAIGLMAFLNVFPQFGSSLKIARGISDAQLLGRWQTVFQDPLTIVDIGHNPQAAKRLAQRARATGKTLHLVVGMLADKDASNSLAAFAGQSAKWYLANLSGPRACLAQTLLDKLPTTERTQASLFDSPRSAWQAARQNSDENALILVWGSFLTVADVMQGIASAQRE